jgi:ankyrin repeat protein
LAAFKGFEDMAEAVIKNVKETINQSELKLWVNLKTVDDGFTALHFASFRGNIYIIQALLENGADMYAKNNFGINVMHVAA